MFFIGMLIGGVLGAYLWHKAIILYIKRKEDAVINLLKEEFKD